MSTPPDPNSNRSKKKRRRKEAWLRYQRQSDRKLKSDERKANVVSCIKDLLSGFSELLPNRNRGRDFELWADRRLSVLERFFPDVVRIVRQEAIELTNGLRVIPDFRLEVQEPEGKQIRTIECQSRRRSSNTIVQKLRDMRTHSKYNRFMLLYSDSGYLSSRVVAALDADGIVHYAPDGFVAFLARVAWKTYCLHPSRLERGTPSRMQEALVRCRQNNTGKGEKSGTDLFALILAMDIEPHELIGAFMSRVDPDNVQQIVELMEELEPKDEGMCGSR